jgi:hypothetical protein
MPQEHGSHLQDHDVKERRTRRYEGVCYPTICKANWGCWVKDFQQASELRTRLGKGSGASVLVEDLLGVGPNVRKGVGEMACE